MRTNVEKRLRRYVTISSYKKADGTPALRSKTKYYYVSRHRNSNNNRRLAKSTGYPRGESR